MMDFCFLTLITALANIKIVMNIHIKILFKKLGSLKAEACGYEELNLSTYHY